VFCFGRPYRAIQVAHPPHTDAFDYTDTTGINMTAVKLDELENAAIVVEDGEGETRALVSRESGMIHLLNDEYMDEEAPVPADGGKEGHYVMVPPASSLGIGDGLVVGFAAKHLPGDEATVGDLFRAKDVDGFFKLLDERGAREDWQQYRLKHTRAALGRWCEEHGLELQG
jgi:hypothetical protein